MCKALCHGAEAAAGTAVSEEPSSDVPEALVATAASSSRVTYVDCRRVLPQCLCISIGEALLRMLRLVDTGEVLSRTSFNFTSSLSILLAGKHTMCSDA